MVSDGTSHHSTTAGILAEYYVLFIIALVLLALRIWVRARISKLWGWDDFCIIVSWIFLLIGLILIQIEAKHGLGRHLTDLENPKKSELEVLKYNTFFQMDNVLCTLFTKYSISLYILRIRNSKRLRWVLASLMVFMTLATIAVIVVLSISCIPLESLWDKSVPGKCLPFEKIYYCAYVQSGFTIVIDLGLTTAPIIILWDVKIQNGRKVLICCLMSLGLISTVSNALRNKYQTDLVSQDMTYDITPVTVVAILELSSGIIAACVPACMPLVTKGRKTANHATGYYGGYGSYGKQSIAPESFRLQNSSTRTDKSLDSSDDTSLHPLTQPPKAAMYSPGQI